MAGAGRAIDGTGAGCAAPVRAGAGPAAGGLQGLPAWKSVLRGLVSYTPAVARWGITGGGVSSCPEREEDPGQVVVPERRVSLENVGPQSLLPLLVPALGRIGPWVVYPRGSMGLPQRRPGFTTRCQTSCRYR